MLPTYISFVVPTGMNPSSVPFPSTFTILRETPYRLLPLIFSTLKVNVNGIPGSITSSSIDTELIIKSFD